MSEAGDERAAGAGGPPKSSLVLWYIFAGPAIGVTLVLLVSHGLGWLKLGYVPAFGQFGVWGTVLYFASMFGIGYLIALLPTALAGVVLMHVEANRPGRLLAASVIAPVLIVALFALLFGFAFNPGTSRFFTSGGFAAWWTMQAAKIAAICAAASLLTVLLHPASRRARRGRDERAGPLPRS